VRGFADLIGESIPPGSADLEYLDRIKAAAKAIENQLAFMREYTLEAAPSSMEWIDVRNLFLEVTMGMGLFGVKIEVLFEGLLIYSDRLLAKIFSTLIDNSISHGERVDRITLSFYEAGDKGILVYEDNGIGIPPDQKERIFERGSGGTWVSDCTTPAGYFPFTASRSGRAGNTEKAPASRSSSPGMHTCGGMGTGMPALYLKCMLHTGEELRLQLPGLARTSRGGQSHYPSCGQAILSGASVPRQPRPRLAVP